MERLKAFSVKKFTLDGRKFHTLTILSAKYLCTSSTVNTAWFVQFVTSSTENDTLSYKKCVYF